MFDGWEVIDYVKKLNLGSVKLRRWRSALGLGAKMASFSSVVIKMLENWSNGV